MPRDLTASAIRGSVWKVRNKWKLDSVLPSLWLHVSLSRLQMRPHNCKIEIVEDYKLPDVEAEADYENRKIRIRKTTFANALRGFPHERMTVAHEIWHLLFGHRNVRTRRYNQQPGKFKNPDEEREEREAKRAAAEFLIPYHLLAECNSPIEIEERFLVSRQAAEIAWEGERRRRRHFGLAIHDRPSDGGPDCAGEHGEVGASQHEGVGE